MNPVEKLLQVGDATRHEPAGDEVSVASSRLPAELADCITYVVSPHNRQMPVLKAMTTTVCERNCGYCGFRRGRDVRRVTLSPDEMADGFHRLYRAGPGRRALSLLGHPARWRAVAGQHHRRGRDPALNTDFKGYLHLKVMPGADYDQIVRTMQLADRVSVNLEAPTADRLERLAPRKGFADELLAAVALDRRDPRRAGRARTQLDYPICRWAGW